MGKRAIIASSAFVVCGVIAYFIATRRAWGPDLLDDPLYRSGRESLCKAPALSGDSVTVRIDDRGQTVRSAGFEHAWEHRFDAGTLTGGTIHLCSEYGSVRIQGIDGTEGRLLVTMSDPFPGGDNAIRDTRLNSSVRSGTGGLHVAVWQQTQGMTTFRSLLQKGARPVAVNMVLELPRSGPYALSLVANHQRVTVRNLDVRGVIEGYLSPGADLDVGLSGSLKLGLNNGTLKPDWRRDAGVDYQGGTTATLRPLTSGLVDIVLAQGDATVTIVGADVGLDVTAKGAPGGAKVDIGPTEVAGVDTAGTHAVGVGYARSARKVTVRVTSDGGRVVVRRAIQSGTK